MDRRRAAAVVVVALGALPTSAGCSATASPGAASCVAPEVSAPAGAAPGAQIEVDGRHFFDDCFDTGQAGTPAGTTGMEPVLTVDGVRHDVDLVEPLDADAEGRWTVRLAVPGDLAPGASLRVGVSAHGIDYLSDAVSIVAP
ncbi:hypothetical protein [Xylanimonas protaetiae]|uniref:Bacterial spore germination immunoglobulin-like domain-containing protein n=1 Tax=Xylanimonas protaetiae TaxID=2509457 RepID=A0A4P6F576_9MICO|nr:hypothetical protein [Xylanimonas protaetiae]QAY70764.1 hypothetical protein ET471_12645 [Xylanimonas protaetiae]